MITETHKIKVAAAACLFAFLSFINLAIAQSKNENQPTANMTIEKYKAAANKHVNDAVAVVQRMESDARVKTLLRQAKGVFIAPTYGRAALGVGAGGGSAVLLVKRDDGTWSDPVFYNIGGVNVGLQAGVEGGMIALVLNNEKAVDRFMQPNNFSLSADAGLTVFNWAKMAQGSTGPGDVVVWAGTKGLFGDVVTLGVNDIRFNQNLTSAYYHRTLSAKDVITGKTSNPQADALKQALGSATTGSATSSGAGQ